MNAKISAFYGADLVDDGGRKIGTLDNKTIVEIVEPFGKPARRTGEWVKVKSGDVVGWVRSMQVEAPTEPPSAQE